MRKRSNGIWGARVAGLALLLTAVASCGRVIVNTPMPRQGDDWDLTLTKLTDGPNSFNEGGGLVHKPADGDRFIFAHITLHNRSRSPRKFSFDRCDLDDGNSAVVPALVSLAVLNGDGNHEPELAADETIDRRLIFAYPENRSPSRLRCEPMTFPLPQM